MSDDALLDPLLLDDDTDTDLVEAPIIPEDDPLDGTGPDDIVAPDTTEDEDDDFEGDMDEEL